MELPGPAWRTKTNATLLLLALAMASIAQLAPRASAAPGDPVLVGTVTDNVTSLPVPGALVHIQGNTVPYLNETATNATGEYSIELPPGNYLFAVAHGDYYLYLDVALDVTANATLDVALDPAPPRDALLMGFVTDNATGLPITTGRMTALTPAFAAPVYINLSALDGAGYYQMNVIPGEYSVESDVPGYLLNQTVLTLSSGGSAWANMSLDPIPPENSTFQGYVTDASTGLPIPGAFVSAEVGPLFNSTSTDGTGFYTINTAAGTFRLAASAAGYARAERDVPIADGETRWENFTLVRTDATVRGYITDEYTSAPLGGALVFVGNMGNFTNVSAADAGGYFEMQTVPGSLIVASQSPGYVANGTFITVISGETRWQNLTLRPEDAVLRGLVREFGTGTPLGGVDVRLRAAGVLFDNGTLTDGSGAYAINYASGPALATATLGGYQDFQADVDLGAGDNWLNITLYPNLPENATVQGFVNGAGPLPGARVRAEGFGAWFNETTTDGTAFYSMNVVPASLTLFTRASGHAPDWTPFTAVGGSTLWLNITLAADPTPPNVTALDVNPSVNVSANNPTVLTGNVVETWLDRHALSLAMLRNASAGVRNFTMLSTLAESDYSFVETTPGSWDLGMTWDARIPAGWMGNASGTEWVTLWSNFVGPWDLIVGEYRNTSSPTPTGVIALFNQGTGLLELLSFGGPPQGITDPSGELRAAFLVVSLDDFDNLLGPATPVYGSWYSVLDVSLLRDDVVPSGRFGFWLQTWDYGDSYDSRWAFLDVDNTPPTADAGPDQAVLRTETVTFDASASTDNVGIASYTWTFTDGGPVSLSGPSPSHTFNAVGVFPVSLAVTDGAGHTDLAAMTVTVSLDGVPPVADAGPDQTVDEDVVVTFDGSVSSDNVGISNHTWTLTDVSPRALYGVAPGYTFANPGTFVVTLTVRDLDLNTATDTVTITVNDITAPTADAGPDQTVDEDTVMTFDGSASADNVAISNYTWTFDDSGLQTLYGVAPTHTFAAPGSYVVTLALLDAAGASSSDTMVVLVNDATPPTADAGADQTVDEDLTVTFTGSASSDNVGVVNHTWMFDDGGTQTLYGVSPAHTFMTPGTYVVTLTARDAAGNSATDTMTVSVNDVTAPVADAGPDRTVDEDAPVTLNGAGSSDNAAVANSTWTFTDGTARTLYGVSPVHTFTIPGTYTVTLSVRDAAGLTDSDAMTFTVLDVTAPTADAGPDASGLEGATLTFDGTGSTDNVGVTNYTWDLGGGAMAYGPTPTHRFDAPGTNTVTLTVRDAAGNTDTDTHAVTVLADTDGDGTGDAVDEDDDGDGMPDTWESLHDLDPLDQTDSSGDADGDGVTNLDEYRRGTDPNKSDGSGLLFLVVIAVAVIAGILVLLLLLRRRKPTPTTAEKDAEPAEEGPPTPPEESSPEEIPPTDEAPKG